MFVVPYPFEHIYKYVSPHPQQILDLFQKTEQQKWGQVAEKTLWLFLLYQGFTVDKSYLLPIDRLLLVLSWPGKYFDTVTSVRVREMPPIAALNITAHALVQQAGAPKLVLVSPKRRLRLTPRFSLRSLLRISLWCHACRSVVNFMAP